MPGSSRPPRTGLWRISLPRGDSCPILALDGMPRNLDVGMCPNCSEVTFLRADQDRAHQSPEQDVLCVRLDGRRLGFRLKDVREVLPVADTTPLPHAPDVLLGLLNLRGQPVPVLDLRARLGLPLRSLHPDDHVVLCQVGERDVGVWVDRADDILHLDPEDVVPVRDAGPHRHVKGAVMLSDGLMLVTDVDSFLDARESAQLESALAAMTQERGR